MKTGLENLQRSAAKTLARKNVGLVAHQASVDAGLNNALDLLRGIKQVHLSKVFGPQHGLFGQTQDNMIEWEGYRDPERDLEVISLYGQHRKPTPAMLQGLDVLLFDLQDIGARYYTFIHSLSYCMQACGENGVEIWVLDRPNPLGGKQIEGSVLDLDYRSFVGLHPIAVRHGMTIGEMACLLRGAFGIFCQLKVVKMSGWKRERYFDQTGLPWINPSPNMPGLPAALVYPGMCLLEGTNISEGRGTTTPFELFGAPFIEPHGLKKELEREKLPGVYFRPTHFIPTANKFSGAECGGLFLHVTDRRKFRPFLTALAILKALHRLYPQFAWKDPPYEYETEKLPIDILLGNPDLRGMLERDRPLKDIHQSYKSQLQNFNRLRKKYLLYD